MFSTNFINQAENAKIYGQSDFLRLLVQEIPHMLQFLNKLIIFYIFNPSRTIKTVHGEKIDCPSILSPRNARSFPLLMVYTHRFRLINLSLKRSTTAISSTAQSRSKHNRMRTLTSGITKGRSRSRRARCRKCSIPSGKHYRTSPGSWSTCRSCSPETRQKRCTRSRRATASERCSKDQSRVPTTRRRRTTHSWPARTTQPNRRGRC